jgi:HSP20 family protein
MEDELTAAFLDDAAPVGIADDTAAATSNDDSQTASSDDWDEEQLQDMPGMLAVDVYETKEKLLVKARTAGVNKDDLDVSISDNTLTIKGTLSSGDEVDAENYHIQECYWGEFSRTLGLPVPVKEDEVEAVLKDGVLTISFTKVKQETIKKITIS